VSNRPTKKPMASQRVQTASKAAERSRTIWIFVAVFVVVAVIAIVAIAMRGGGSSNPGGAASKSGGTVVPGGNLAYGSIDVKGTALPQYSGTGSDPGVGQTAPDVVGQQFDNSRIAITNDGKPKVVMFVAHWCPHCQAEVPRIQKWLDDNGMPSDVELYTVATATDSSKPNYSPAAWLRRAGWSVPTMVDDKKSDAATAYGLASYPYFVAVGANGKVVQRGSGELTTDQWVALLDAARQGSGGSVPATGAASPS